MHFHYQGHRILSTRTANLKFAKRRATVIEAELLQGNYQHEGSDSNKKRQTKRVKLAYAISRYRSNLITEGKRLKTRVKYEGILTKLQTHCECQNVLFLDQLDVATFDGYRESQRDIIGQASMQYEGGAIKRFLSFCVGRNLINENPLESIRFKKPDTKESKVLTLDQIDLLLATASRLRRFIFALLAFTGMRISEAQHLRIEDVDLENGWIDIVSRQGFETKTGKSWRVPIHPRLHQILLETDWPESGWFFTARPSKKYPAGDHNINPRRINEDFKKVLGELGIPVGRDSGFTVHSLRHFFKTHCIVKGKVPKPVVDLWQGHELDRRKASNSYFHLTDEDSMELMKSVSFGD